MKDEKPCSCEPCEREEPSELAMVGEALSAARTAFENCLTENHCVEPAYYRLSLRVELRDASFTETLGEFVYRDLH